MAVEPFPHVEMHVRDESIYEAPVTQVTPLHKPIYMMRTQKGDVGVPVWCPTYMDAVRKFGAETFNTRSKFYSEQAYFLLKTFSFGQGAWIMRTAEETAKAARAFLEVGVLEDEVRQWKRNSITGKFVLNDLGEKIAIDISGNDITDASGNVILAVKEGEEVYEYTRCMDANLVADKLESKLYAARLFSKYNYAPVTEAVATKDEVLYKGAGEPVATKVKFDDVDTSRTDVIYFTAEISSVGASTTITYSPVAIGAEKKAAETYYTLAYEEYEAYIVHVGDAVDFGTFYRRSPDLYGAYEYVTFNGSTLNGVAVQAGDAVDVDGNVSRPVKSVGYNPTEDAAPVDGKEYYLLDGESYAKADVAAGFDPAQTYYEQVEVEVLEFKGNIGSALYIQSEKLSAGDAVPQATVSGVRLIWRVIQRNAADERAVDSAEPTQSDVKDSNGNLKRVTWYPVMSVIADNPGSWGEKFGYRFFYDAAQNTIAGIMQNGAVTYTVAPVELYEGETTPRDVYDAFGQTAVTGVMKENVVDAISGLDLTMGRLLDLHYIDDYQLPVDTIFIPQTFETVGRILMNAEVRGRDAAKRLYPELVADDVLSIFVDDVLGLEPGAADESAVAAKADAGYMANVVSCVGPSGVPYFAADCVSSIDSSFSEAVDLKSSNAFYLGGGEDGDIEDWDIEMYIRRYIDAFINGTHQYLVDYLRCDYNCIFDVGFSLETKKKLLEFMNYRDNLMVFLTPQSTMKYQIDTIVAGNPVKQVMSPEQLTQFEEESIGAMLRTYALLMIDDVENNTGANRCAIFLSSGINTDHQDLHGLTPFTLWCATKYAKFLNGTSIKGAPIEDNSIVDCFDKVAWTAFADNTRSRIWNAGLCYPQYMNRTEIQVAALRTVYRYDTSVLCDIGTAMAVTFAKDIIRDEFPHWVNSDREASDLNSRIAKKLSERAEHAFAGRYMTTFNVYQTAEDMKLGYVRHVDLELTANAANRVWKATIICKRAGFDASAED